MRAPSTIAPVEIQRAAETQPVLPPPERPATPLRPVARGKFIYAGDEKLYVRGVTYGTFRADAHSFSFPPRDVIECDLTRMAASGLNAVRTYSVPPPWFLDIALHCDLRVMVGVPWEQHIAFLDSWKRVRDIEQRVRDAVRSCQGHPAILSYAIGNEIPSPIVRWYGRRKVEGFIRRLYDAAKSEDPYALVTYVNYPSTEYLQLPFIDVVSFNVYLESEQRLKAYLARLHSLAGERPLIMAELGLDSRRHGLDVQANVLDWQLRTAFASGCAGAFIFAWTDEWHRGGNEIEDWDFGLTTRDRAPKKALLAVQGALSEVPFPRATHTQRISVVVCARNEQATLGETLCALSRLHYPDYEVIVVDDGSTDATPAIAQRYRCAYVRIEKQGLSAARNVGLGASSGDIIAYLDADAYPDPHWLEYLSAAFAERPVAAVGGPNIAPPQDTLVAQCVAHVPGGPTHVLLTDRDAEHIPGCNMAFRRSALESIGGFDPRFRTAGDDVDVCWRLAQQGMTLGFSPAAMVWHHRRSSVRGFLRQQIGYGKAEGLLEQKWPEKYNSMGHFRWKGRLYQNGNTEPLFARKSRVYHGTWGSGLFQSIYSPAQDGLAAWFLMPEWYLVVLALALLTGLGIWWPPLLYLSPVAAIAAVIPLARAAHAALSIRLNGAFPTPMSRAKAQALSAVLYLLQPVGRLVGRLQVGLTPWRHRAWLGLSLPRPRRFAYWREQWQSAGEILSAVENRARAAGSVVQRGGDYDTWDLELRVGMNGAVRMLMAIEEHGNGKQLIRFRLWPAGSLRMYIIMTMFALLSLFAGLDGSPATGAILGAVAIVTGLLSFFDCGLAASAAAKVLSTSFVDGNIKERPT